MERVGVEGTGTFGAGLTRFVPAYGLAVVEVARPDPSMRRRQGKSDPIDAQAAARATLAGVATATPKTREGQVEMIRLLPVARRGAMKARVAAAEQLYGVLCSAPEELRQPLLGSRPRPSLGPVRLCGRATHQHHRRHQDHPVEPGPALATAPGRTRPARPPAPSTGHLGRPHPGRPTRGRDRDRRPAAGHRRRQPQRLRSEAAFAHLCGTPPSQPPRPAPTATGSTAAATAGPTTPCGASPWSACAATHRPGPMCSDGPTKAYPSWTSRAASSATSPARSTTSSQAPHPSTLRLA